MRGRGSGRGGRYEALSYGRGRVTSGRYEAMRKKLEAEVPIAGKKIYLLYPSISLHGSIWVYLFYIFYLLLYLALSILFIRRVEKFKIWGRYVARYTDK